MQEFTHEMYYGDPKTIDLNKMREEAEKRQRGDYYRGPESTRIHHHRDGEPCKGYTHEQYGIPSAD